MDKAVNGKKKVNEFYDATFFTVGDKNPITGLPHTEHAW